MSGAGPTSGGGDAPGVLDRVDLSLELESLRRFRDREADPFKRWRTGPADWKARGQWDPSQEGIETLFDRTSSDAAPSHVIVAEHAGYGRVAVLETVMDPLAAFSQLPCEELPAGWKLPGD